MWEERLLRATESPVPPGYMSGSSSGENGLRLLRVQGSLRKAGSRGNSPAPGLPNTAREGSAAFSL
jgi:hypothetical protein